MPIRTCVGCRCSAEKRELVRIVHAGGSFVVDARQTAPGRGAYLHPGCLDRALRTRALARALRVSAGSPGQAAGLIAALAPASDPASDAVASA